MAEHATQTATRQNAQSTAAQQVSEAVARQHSRPEGGWYEFQKTLGNQAMQRSLLASQSGIPGLQRKCASCEREADDDTTDILQTKLTINQPGDIFEQEADRVADAVMSGKASNDHIGGDTTDGSGPQKVQRACACGGTCDDCQRKVDVLQCATPGSTANLATAPAIVHDVLRSSGRPLDTSTRTFMESRLGADFSGVRVHTDSRAAESARAINALAYTVGRDVVFGEGQFVSGNQGRHLLAHELAHVIQQDLSAARVQRVCSKTDLGPPPASCVIDRSLTPSTSRYLFNVDCDAFAPGEEARLASAATGFTPKSTVNILGMASTDGPATLNDTLSCLRADQAVAVVKRSAPSTVKIASVNATGGIGPSGDASFRAASVDVSAPKPTPKPKCGPDATDWLVTQVNTALTDRDVLSVQSSLHAADAIARSHGTSADIFAEAGGTTAVEAQEAALPRLGFPAPARTGAIVGQLTAGTTSQALATATAISSPFTSARITTLIGVAALKWRALVNHSARYDFKNHTDSMDQPHSAHCPDPSCPATEHGTITLCPGAAAAGNCYESDLPGNLFYAYIGRFIGWSELTLQLGSELAELTDLPRAGRPAVTWDSPEDTAAIHLGFRLAASLPLTRAALCGAVGPARSSLDSVAACEDCSELTTAVIR
jgi:hypothetical protein